MRARIELLASLPELYAYVGEDELGSGEVGLKQADVPAGRIPLVSIHAHKLDHAPVRAQLRAQVNRWGKTIRLVKYVPVEVLLELEPPPDVDCITMPDGECVAEHCRLHSPT